MSTSAPEIEQLARKLWGEPNSEHSTRDELRFGTHGSKSVKLKARTWFDHEADEGGGYVDLYVKVHGERPADASIIATYDYRDAAGKLVFQVVRKVPKKFVQRRPDTNGGWIWDMHGVERVPYRLPELLRAGPDAPVFICEGEKDCDALHERGLIATTNPGGAGKWRPNLWQHFRGRNVVILSDNDPQATTPEGALRWHPDGRPVLPGQDHAADVAAKLGGIAASARVVMLPDLPLKGDVSDWLASGGTAEELERIASEAVDQDSNAAKAPPPNGAERERGQIYGRLKVFGTADLDTAAPRSYLLKGLISPAEISLWVGPPKCGKSFLMLHVAYRLSLGLPVFGRRVKKTCVLYVAAEGEGGIANRIKALRDRYGNAPDFHFIAQPADLLHREGHLADLIKAAKAIGAQLIVLDTLSRLLAGGDENAPGDMGTFIANVATLRHDTQAHIAIVHHGTKSSNGSTPRGHSSLTGADDALIEVIKLDDGSRTATVIHAKDDADGDRFGFKLSRVELGTDPDGDPIATLIVDEMTEPAPTSAQAPSLSSNEKIAMRCFDSAFKADAITATVGPAFDERLVVRVGDWRRWFYQEGKPGEDANTKRMAFNRARDALLAKSCIAAENDFVWPVKRR